MSILAVSSQRAACAVAAADFPLEGASQLAREWRRIVRDQRSLLAHVRDVDFSQELACTAALLGAFWAPWAPLDGDVGVV